VFTTLIVYCVYHVNRLLHDLLGEGREKYFSDGVKITAAPFTVVLKAASKVSTGSTITSEKNTMVEEDAFGIMEGDIAEESSMSDPYLIALETYSALQSDAYELGVSPDHVLFAAMLDVIGEHTDADSIERRQRIEEIFHDACQAGQVSSLVVRSLQKACPNEDILKELLQLRRSDAVVSIESVNSFPKQWIRFVPPEFRRISTRSEHFRKQSDHYKKRGKDKTSKSGEGKQKRQTKKFIF